MIDALAQQTPRRIASRALVALVLGVLVSAFLAAPAPAKTTLKKSIWGPVEKDGVSQFPIYKDLGAGLYQTSLSWASVAPNRPLNPTNPLDPAYQWPAEIDRAIAEGQKHGIEVSLLVFFTPRWANGGRSLEWAPDRAQDYADFIEAAAKRYPQVRHWMIWGEPCRSNNWKPLTPEDAPPGNFTPNTPPRRLTAKQAAAPRRYARLLDAAYGRLKAANRRNLVIGGNTWTACEISPFNFIKHMRLPNGRPPRLDMFGHNPFTTRKPDLRNPPTGNGWADFSDLKRLTGWVDRNLSRRGQRRGSIEIFLSEFFVATDHTNDENGFFRSRRVVAQWLSSGLRIVRGSRRFYTLGWLSLYDDPRRADNLQIERGLLTREGRKKPAYFSFKKG